MANFQISSLARYVYKLVSIRSHYVLIRNARNPITTSKPMPNTGTPRFEPKHTASVASTLFQHGRRSLASTSFPQSSFYRAHSTVSNASMTNSRVEGKIQTT